MRPEHACNWLLQRGVRIAFSFLVLALVAMPAIAQDDEAEEERDLRPARERHALDTEYAIGRWSLEFDYDTPDSVVIEHEDGSRERITYMTFSVRNPTERRLPLRLSFTLTTDVERGPMGQREKMTYVDIASPLAESQVEQKLGPLENSATEMRGMKREEMDGEEKDTVKISYIEPGELRRGIAIFGAVTDHADTLTIEVQGLVDPIRYDRKEIVSEIKVLRIKYERRGDEHERHLDLLHHRGDEWVIKSTTKIRDRAR